MDRYIDRDSEWLSNSGDEGNNKLKKCLQHAMDKKDINGKIIMQ